MPGGLSPLFYQKGRDMRVVQVELQESDGPTEITVRLSDSDGGMTVEPRNADESLALLVASTRLIICTAEIHAAHEKADKADDHAKAQALINQHIQVALAESHARSTGKRLDDPESQQGDKWK